MVIAFGASELSLVPTNTADGSGDPSSSSVAGATPSEPRGLDLNTVQFHLPAAVLRDADSARQAFVQQLGQHGITANTRVGLVLLFGVSNACIPGSGTAESRRLKDAVSAQLPPSLAGAQFRTYIGRGECGSVDVELFVLAGER